MMQPSTTSGAVEKPYSSAPSSAAITTSRPVFIWPSTWTTIRSRSLFSTRDRKSTRLNSSHGYISYAVFCLKKKKNKKTQSAPDDVSTKELHVRIHNLSLY